jgi:hypothetical protein
MRGIATTYTELDSFGICAAMGQLSSPPRTKGVLGCVSICDGRNWVGSLSLTIERELFGRLRCAIVVTGDRGLKGNDGLDLPT